MTSRTPRMNRLLTCVGDMVQWLEKYHGNKPEGFADRRSDLIALQTTLRNRGTALSDLLEKKQRFIMKEAMKAKVSQSDRDYILNLLGKEDKMSQEEKDASFDEALNTAISAAGEHFDPDIESQVWTLHEDLKLNTIIFRAALAVFINQLEDVPDDLRNNATVLHEALEAVGGGDGDDSSYASGTGTGSSCACFCSACASENHASCSDPSCSSCPPGSH